MQFKKQYLNNPSLEQRNVNIVVHRNKYKLIILLIVLGLLLVQQWNWH